MSVTQDFRVRKPKHTKTSLRRYGELLGRYLRPYWGKALLMSVLLLVSLGLQLAVPQILRFFIDTAAEGGSHEVLVRTALLFLTAALVNQLAGAGATYFGTDVGWSATNKLREDLARHCLSLDMRFHSTRTPGELIERIDGDVTALSNFFSQFVVRVLGGVILLVGVLVLLWLEHPLVGLLMSVFSVAIMVALNRMRERAVPATTAERETTAKLYGFVEERLAGIDDIRANGGGRFVMNRFYEVMRDFFFTGRRAWMQRFSIWFLSFGFFTVGDLIALGSAIYLYQASLVSLGTAYLFFQYLLMLETPIEQITQQMQELQKATAGIGRITELLETESELVPGGTKTLPAGPLGVRFERVSFAYDDKPILRDLSFELKPGTVLGLLGRTGSGKSTLTRLLFRFYDPSSGAVRLGGYDTRDLDPRALHRRVGIVTQEVQLFQATIRDNLTFFDDSVDDTRLYTVLDDLGLRPWLGTLPHGLDTQLGAGGEGLSAGQAQLLAFARVFLKDPGLVVLDEPSSRLDPASERLLAKALERLLSGRTAIIIAHRLDTVQRADEIMILADGDIVEHDRRDRLVRDPHSRFAALLRASQGDADLDHLKELV